ncbi:hypothetical protein DFA_08176 [Cavenderia fasciculata]|uniref:Choline transporter-like protein n=1 Tax=Cavenderia fasciculata TaxID=261658 RepID=F4Q5D0_CACFS|nr:uncharacterized protein DFA_08176 [Cavenderia fasciculata]EGG17189.1 hypothetical protein DFA_08176 [Cavenderia fasciculata]|eukprot:XP_004355673.1 hypothetical protein DFA_08176 [Cavenderia fasciculata]
MWAQEEEVRKPLLSGGSDYYGIDDDSSSKKKSSSSSDVQGVRKTSCNDILFLILFLGCVVAMAVISGFAYSRGNPSVLIPQNQIINTIGNQTEQVITSGIQNAVAQMRQNKDVLIYSVILSIALAAVWVELLKNFTRFFIYLTLCLGVALVVCLGGVFVFIGRKEDSEATQIVGYCLMASTIILIAVIIYLKKSIDLTCAMFTETCRGVQRNPSVFIVGFLVIIAFVGFLAYWTSSFIYLFSIPGQSITIGDSSDSSDIIGLPHFNSKIRNLMFFMIFAFCWVTSFISAVFQHVVAGAVSHWYFSRNPTGETNIGNHNAFTSLGRALSTSMGSLALGSLIIGFIEFMGVMLRISKNTNAENKLLVFVINCLQCILSCVEGIVRWVNKFGYIYVSMHGYSFCKSTKDCFDMVSRNMFSAIIMDFIGSFVLLLGKFLVTAGTGIFSSLLLYALGRSLKDNALTVGLAALFAFCITNIFTHIIGIGTDTIFVCYLEDLEENGRDGNLYISSDLHELLQQKQSTLKKKDVENN